MLPRSKIDVQNKTSISGGAALKQCPRVQVFRYDAAAPMGHCRATGDPHLVTFDGVSYDIYTTGNFIYARNLAYMPVEVIVLLCH